MPACLCVCLCGFYCGRSTKTLLAFFLPSWTPRIVCCLAEKEGEEGEISLLRTFIGKFPFKSRRVNFYFFGRKKGKLCVVSLLFNYLLQSFMPFTTLDSRVWAFAVPLNYFPNLLHNLRPPSNLPLLRCSLIKYASPNETVVERGREKESEGI